MTHFGPHAHVISFDYFFFYIFKLHYLTNPTGIASLCLIFALLPHMWPYFLLIILALILFLSFFFLISRNYHNELNHLTKHRILATNIAPWPWMAPHCKCHWTPRRWVRIRRGHCQWSRLSFSVPTNANTKTRNSWSHFISTLTRLRTRTQVSIMEARSSFHFYFSFLNPYRKEIYKEFPRHVLCFSGWHLLHKLSQGKNIVS